MKRYCPRKARQKKRWKAERRREKFERTVKRQQHKFGEREFFRKLELDVRSQAIRVRKLIEELDKVGARYVVKEVRYGPGWYAPTAAVSSLTVEIRAEWGVTDGSSV